MDSLSHYLAAISARGDRYGGSGGVLDLLTWCGKLSTQSVTPEEAKRFYDNPRSPHEALCEKERTRSTTIE
jgi:hypothetical protein